MNDFSITENQGEGYTQHLPNVWLVHTVIYLMDLSQNQQSIQMFYCTVSLPKVKMLMAKIQINLN